MTTTDTLVALLATLDPGTTVYSGEVPTVPAARYMVVYDTTALHGGRNIDGRARQVREAWSVVCVNNSPPGAHLIADRVWRLADGQLLDGRPVWADLIGPVIEDRDDPSRWQWSCTVELHRTATR